MAKVGDTSFFGTSRTVYRFSVYDLDSNFKDEIAAVYVLSAKNAKGQYQPLYIGETSKLGIDVSRERAMPIVRGHNDAHICVHLDGDETSRRSKTSDLIAYYKPSGNSR
jgi:hypothetical protein